MYLNEWKIDRGEILFQNRKCWLDLLYNEEYWYGYETSMAKSYGVFAEDIIVMTIFPFNTVVRIQWNEKTRKQFIFISHIKGNS